MWDPQGTVEPLNQGRCTKDYIKGIQEMPQTAAGSTRASIWGV